MSLAEATRHDSFSMKTIAVMTMVFLPGTFFAALFAVPSLQWDQPTVIQDNFWVYWAFTVPCTLCVILTWALFSYRDVIRRAAKPTLQPSRAAQAFKDELNAARIGNTGMVALGNNPSGWISSGS
jgi:hypothetical protein